MDEKYPSRRQVLQISSGTAVALSILPTASGSTHSNNEGNQARKVSFCELPAKAHPVKRYHHHRQDRPNYANTNWPESRIQDPANIGDHQ